MNITIKYAAIDGFSKSRSYSTIEGARKFAIQCVGETPELGSRYAVSFDGIGKVTATGVSLDELFFGTKPAAVTLPYEVWSCVVDEDRGTSRKVRDGAFTTLPEANQFADQIDAYCDGVHLVGTTDEAKAAIRAQDEAYAAQLFMDSYIAGHSPF